MSNYADAGVQHCLQYYSLDQLNLLLMCYIPWYCWFDQDLFFMSLNPCCGYPFAVKGRFLDFSVFDWNYIGISSTSNLLYKLVEEMLIDYTTSN